MTESARDVIRLMHVCPIAGYELFPELVPNVKLI